MNIFVGNLSFKANEADVKNLFEGFGSVASVRILMEKRGDKSRGFGFVQIPDEQQALAAIAALNGKEFMDRPLHVSPARPKPEGEQDKGEAKKSHFEIKVKSQGHPKEKGDKKDAWYKPVFDKKIGRYKRGRRSQSFMKRRAASGTAQEAIPEQEGREKPMRWRKNYEQPKPWQKSQEELKPRKKTDGESKSWGKNTGQSKPWRKNKRRSRPRQSRIESRRKPGGYTKG